LASSGLKFIDSVFIGKYLKLEFVGIFTVAAFIAVIIEIPLNALERIAHVQVATLWAKGDMKEIENIYYKSVKYLMLIGGVLLVGIIVNIKDVLLFLPADYHSAYNVTIIASIGAFINIATGVNNAILYNSDKYIYGTYLLLLLLVLTIVTNIIFIPMWGIIGSAFASALSATIYNLVKFLIIWSKFKMQPYDVNTFKIILIILISFLLVYFIPFSINPAFAILIRSMLILVCYLFMVYVFKIIPEFHHYIPFINKKSR